MLVLSSTGNTFSNGLTLSAGTIEAIGNVASGNVTTFGTGPVTLNTGGILF